MTIITKSITIFGTARSKEGDSIYEEARKLGALLASENYIVCSGGFHGAMEAVSRGAHESGGRVLGITCSHLAAKIQPNPWLHKIIEECDIHTRIKRLIESDALVAVSGGIGTLAEISIAWNLLQTAGMEPKPLVLLGSGWRNFLQAIKETLVVGEDDFKWVKVVDTPNEVVLYLNDFFMYRY